MLTKVQKWGNSLAVRIPSAFAKEMGLKWIYLGYAVQNSDSLNYKFDYKPQKRLINHPELEDEAIWL